MRKIIYSVAMSLDGYVSGPNGESDWIVMDPEIDFMGMMSRFDTVVMGRRTFEAAQRQGGGGSMPGVGSIVVSKTLRPADHPGVEIIGENLGARMNLLRQKPGKDIWLFGGGTLFRSLLELKLVDRVEVAVVPVLLGKGVPLLPECSRGATLELMGCRSYQATGTVSLEYAVRQ